MKLVWAILQPRKLDEVVEALQGHPGIGGISVTDVRGFGRQRGRAHLGEVPALGSLHFVPKVRIDLVVLDEHVDETVRLIVERAHTGTIGDGKVFVSPVEAAVRIRTGQQGEPAL